MTVTQTIEIPDNRRVFFEFLAPQEIPTGKTMVEVKLTPVIEKQDKAANGATPHTDALLGILEGMGPIDLDELRTERILSKHAKHLK